MGKKSTKDTTGVERWIVLPDFQVPHHDVRSVNAVEQYMADHRWDGYINLGDFLDFNELSKFNIGYPGNVEERVATTFAAGREILERHVKLVRAQNPKARMILIEGNHDYRVKDYTLRHPELDGFLDVEKNLNLKALKIEWADTWTTKQPVRVGKAGFLHGNKVGMYHAKMMVQNYCENIYYGHCFSEDTELLTEAGWKFRSQLSLEDRAVTLNSHTGLLEYNAIKSFTDYDHYKQLYALKSDHTDLLVTDKHGLVDVINGYPEFFAAEDFGHRRIREIPLAGMMHRTGLPLSDDLLRLLVWIVADGSFENMSLVRFHLKKERKIRRLTTLLKGMGIQYSLNRGAQHTTRINFTMPSQLQEWFPGVKELPRRVVNASYAQALVILSEYAHTDGCYTGAHSLQIGTGKKTEADTLQELAVTNGMRCNVTFQKIYTLAIHMRADSANLTADRISVEPYQGAVWCCTVENGTLLVRRNGKTAITQNTHDIMEIPLVRHGHDNVIVGKSLGCLCNYDQRYLKGNPTKWQQAFSVFYFLPDGYFSELTMKIFKHRFVSPDGKIYQG